MFEYRVLRRIFGPKRDEVAGEWRKPHNWELNDWVIKWRRVMCAGYVACMEERRGFGGGET
jgi:hypothetical protein